MSNATVRSRRRRRARAYGRRAVACLKKNMAGSRAPILWAEYRAWDGEIIGENLYAGYFIMRRSAVAKTSRCTPKWWVR